MDYESINLRFSKKQNLPDNTEYLNRISNVIEEKVVGQLTAIA